MRWYCQISMEERIIEGKVQLSDIEIDDQQLWEDDTYMVGNITIKAGGRLCLRGMTLYMAAGKEIVVETGGRLLVDNSTITNFNGNAPCSDGDASFTLWKGIRVHGNTQYTQYQTDGNENLRQGFVNIYNNSLIEHADIALFVEGGGIVFVDEAVFFNSHMSVFFGPYLHYAGGIIFNNRSKLTNVEFDWNADYRATLNWNHVLMFQVNGISMKNVVFKNTYGGEYVNRGIWALDSYFTIDASEPGSSSFSGFTYGIAAGNAVYSWPFSVKNTHFEKSRNSIYSTSINFASIQDCTFDIGDYADEDAIQEGIYMEAGTGYLIKNNEFTQDGAAEKTIGIRVKDSGPNQNLINQNTFLGLGRGNQAEGTNVDITNPEFGLVYRCNFNMDVVETDFRTMAPGVNRQQGLWGDPARNTFSLNAKIIRNESYIVNADI